MEHCYLWHVMRGGSWHRPSALLNTSKHKKMPSSGKLQYAILYDNLTVSDSTFEVCLWE